MIVLAISRAMLDHTDEVIDLELARECPRCGHTLFDDTPCRCRRAVPHSPDHVFCVHGRLFGYFGCPRCGRHMLVGANI